MRSPFPLLALLLALAAATTAVAGGGGAVNEPLLGVAGQPDRFERQTGQESQIRQIFLGWGQGSTRGSPFAQLLDGLRPMPMLHIGTDRGPARTDAITPAQIAAGRGDTYLVALNQAIAAFGDPMYVRVMAEMNNPKNLYAPTRPNGSSKGPSHSPSAYKQAFRRAYLILHGGADVDTRLRRLGQRPLGRELAVNPPTTLTVIWNPIAGFDARSPRPAQEFYPGDAFVDMVGNDIFASRRGVASHAANEALYRAHPSKPYALPEWGLSVDDPGFVRRICRFLSTTRRTRLAVYHDARPQSSFDLGSKPRSRAEYRRCITPLAGAQLTLTAGPARGDAPLAVTFAPRATLPKPVVRWELAFGDGKVQQGSGRPPATVSYTYAKDGLYTAIFVAYAQPPFGGIGIRQLAQAQVRVGRRADQPLRLTAAPDAGKAPFSATFRATATAAATGWEFVPGDGTSRSGEGKPPRLLGHTYTEPGTYRAVLIVELGPGERVLASVEVRAR
jgi:hypothetical protein